MGFSPPTETFGAWVYPLQGFSSVKTLEFVNTLQNNVFSHIGSGTLLFSRRIGPRQAVFSYPNGTGLLPLFERKAAGTQAIDPVQDILFQSGNLGVGVGLA